MSAKWRREKAYTVVAFREDDARMRVESDDNRGDPPVARLIHQLGEQRPVAEVETVEHADANCRRASAVAVYVIENFHNVIGGLVLQR